MTFGESEGKKWLRGPSADRITTKWILLTQVRVCELFFICSRTVTQAWKDDSKELGNVRRALTTLRRAEWSKVPNLMPDTISLEWGGGRGLADFPRT